MNAAKHNDISKGFLPRWVAAGAIFFLLVVGALMLPKNAQAQICFLDETCGYCGNEICELDEGFPSCPLDCIPSVCGDFRCAEDETTISCSDDCMGSACGDFQCDPDESSADCPDDCGCGSDSECDDENACNGDETCDFDSGICQSGTVVTCTALDQCHSAGVCNPEDGTCSNPQVPDGTSCSDSDSCTPTDSCQAGTCTGMNPMICVPIDSCHVAGSCDAGTGVCSNPPLDCSDAFGCTNDLCSTTFGCQHMPNHQYCQNLLGISSAKCQPNKKGSNPVTGCVTK